MPCVSCPSVALYRVGEKAYCKNHRDEAVRELGKVRADFDKKSGAIERQRNRYYAISDAKRERGVWTRRWRKTLANA